MAGGVDRLRPHIKTHKLPEVIRMQMAHGITKFKCATIAEAEMGAGCGAPDMLLGYQPAPIRLVDLQWCRNILRHRAISHSGLSVVLLIASAAYHRIVYAGEDSQDMHRVGSALLAATVPLALGLVGDVYVVITKIVGTPTAGLIAGSLALVLLIGLWYAYPLVAAYLRNRTAR